MSKKDEYFIHDLEPAKGIKEVIKKYIYNLQALAENMRAKLHKPDMTNKKYNVSICAIFKNEAIYLKEWIAFNHIIGVDHFYIYNNNSEDDYQNALGPYIEKGWVTLLQWPHNQKQMECYMDCIKRFSADTKWLGFIDIDEFIVPKSTEKIYDFLQRFEDRGSVKIYWKLFGTSGLIDRQITGLVVEDFTVCWPKYCDIGKCFYNTAFGFDPNSNKSNELHHKFWANYKGKDIPPVNVFGHVCTGNRDIADSSNFPIQINHYFTKSYKEYSLKRSKGDVYFEINPHDEEYFYEHEMKCTSTDYSAYKYLVKLKLEMRKQYE